METETQPEQAEAHEVTCVSCGSTHGPHLLTERGWMCLRHLPKLGQLAARRTWRDA